MTQRAAPPPPPSLESRIAAILTNDNASLAELSEVVAETELPIEAVVQDVATLREKATNLVECPDAKAAFDAAEIAEINRKRLDAALPKLRDRLAQALQAERRDKWLAEYQRVKVKHRRCGSSLPPLPPAAPACRTGSPWPRTLRP